MSTSSLRALPVSGTRGVRVPPRPGDLQPADFVPLRLVLVPSGYSVEVHRLDTLLGRHTAADIRLPLPDVSRQHCRFVWAREGWHVIDLNSLNGVRVNDQSVTDAVLHEGDQVRIGGFTFRVELPAAETTEEPLLPKFPVPLPEEERRRAS
jgi:hypothetical protein